MCFYILSVSLTSAQATPGQEFHFFCSLQYSKCLEQCHPLHSTKFLLHKNMQQVLISILILIFCVFCAVHLISSGGFSSPFLWWGHPGRLRSGVAHRSKCWKVGTVPSWSSFHTGTHRNTPSGHCWVIPPNLPVDLSLWYFWAFSTSRTFMDTQKSFCSSHTVLEFRRILMT